MPGSSIFPWNWWNGDGSYPKHGTLMLESDTLALYPDLATLATTALSNASLSATNPLIIEMWGCGGPADNAAGGNGAGGGGGGAYARFVLDPTFYTDWTSWIMRLGPGGIDGDAILTSEDGLTTYCLAKGGHTSSGTTGGLGGSASNCIGDQCYSGGNGANASGANGGGGGGSGGDGSNGNNASGIYGGNTSLGGGTISGGGYGGNGGLSGNPTTPGGPGGGAGGPGNGGTIQPFGKGRVKLTW